MMGDEADSMRDAEMIAEGREWTEERWPSKPLLKVRAAVIAQIAVERRCSRAVASHIYSMKTIKEKQRLCNAEQRRRERACQ